MNSSPRTVRRKRRPPAAVDKSPRVSEAPHTQKY